MRSVVVLQVMLAVAGLALSSCSAGDTTLAEPSSTVGPTLTRTLPVTPGPTPYNAPYPAGSVGYAVSWPQCGVSLPEQPYDFGIVGITNGWAMTRNPCFAELYRWARDGRYEPSIYMNTNYEDDVAQELARGERCRARALCRAENYGWFAAKDAYEYALESDALAAVWWLDVQIVSEWSDDLNVNAWAIEGAELFLRSKGIRVGISSTSFQWGGVAGTAQHHLTVWDASALTREQAAEFCRDGKDFGGGRTELIAWVEQYETVLACGASNRP